MKCANCSGDAEIHPTRSGWVDCYFCGYSGPKATESQPLRIMETLRFDLATMKVVAGGA